MSTARERALLAMLVLLVLLSSVAALAVWRAQSNRNEQDLLERRSAVVFAIEDARANVFRIATHIAAAIFAEDPASVRGLFYQATMLIDEDLDQARTGLAAMGEMDELAALDKVIEQMDQLPEEAELLALLASTDTATKVEMGQQYYPQLWPAFEEVMAELDQVARGQQTKLATERAAADRTADTTLALLIGLSAFAFLAGAAVLIVLVVSVVRPLASLQASVKAIRSGNLGAKANVSGPEEVASLARDFNEMIAERRRAEDAVARKLRVESAVARASTLLVGAEEFDASLNAALQILGEAMGVNRSYIFMLRDDDTRMDNTHEWCAPGTEPQIDKLQDLDATASPWWMERLRSGEAVVLPDVSEMPPEAAAERKRLEKQEIRSLLLVPLNVGGELAGAIGFDDTKGPRLWREEDVTLLRLASESVSAFVARKRAEEALRQSEAKFRQIFENVQDIFYRTDAQGIITEISPSVERWGYTREELIGTQVLDTYEDPEERSGLLKALAERGEVLHYEIRLKAGDGRVVDSSVNARLLRDPDGTPTGVEGFLRDISERKQMEEALREHARRDPLTGVLNHAAIVGELRSLISGGCDGAPCAVAMIDVDGLKAINDTFGHQVGDAALVAVADALARDGALVGRYGGDEFVAVLAGADRRAAERYRREVLGALADTDLRDPQSGADVPLLVSFGLATYPTEAGRIEELIALADSEMYGAKRQRPVRSSTVAVSQPLGSERAAKMVGEVVPLLTSPGELSDKLRLVAHRLSVAAGYDVVNFGLFAPEPEVPPVMNTFGRLPKKLLSVWKDEQRKPGHDQHPVRLLVKQGRPLIFDDPQHDQRLTDKEREMLRAGGIQSAMVAPMLWQDDLIGMLSVGSKRKAAFVPRDAQFLMAVAGQVTAIVRMAALVEQLRSASDRLVEAQTETVMMLAAAAEAHDRTTGLHLQNVRAITETLARELGYEEADAKELALAAVLHDIGKIRVPDVVLSNAGELTDKEWELLKQHTVWGGEFLAGRPGFELAATIARSHHERWDGNGYPDGLAGEAIPEAASIVSVADALDAMISDRPYRARRSVAQAMREIEACNGKQFRPRVVQALVQLHKRKELLLTPSEQPEQKTAA